MDFELVDEHSIADFLSHLQDPNPAQRNDFVDTLPKINEGLLTTAGLKDDNCPVCQESFLSILASEEMAEAMDSPAISAYDLGVTKLPKCDHYFCRKDISKWIISARKDTCPACRTAIGLPSPPPSSRSTPQASNPPPSAAPASASAPTSPPPAFSDEDVANLQAQLGISADEMASLPPEIRSFLHSMGGFQAQGQQGQGQRPREDDRSEYSSMYS